MNGLLKLLRKLMIYCVPQSVKYALARNIGKFLFKVREIVNVHFLDKQLLWLFFKLNELGKAEKIISDHNDELNYLRYLEKVERYKAFGNEFEQRRLDYKEKDFERIIKVNQDLLQQFPDDFLLHDRMARNYVAGGYQNKARFHLFQSLKFQRKQKVQDGKTGLIFIAGMHRGGTGFTERSLRDGLRIKDNTDSLIRRFDDYYPKYGIVERPGYLNAHPQMPDSVMGTHAGAIEANLKTLPLITDRILVIVRDIRQAVVSKVAYSEYLRYTGNFSALINYQYPDGFFYWPLEKKIDWQIDNYYSPADIEWIKGWLKADEDPKFPCEIKFSKFEVLAHDPKKYFQEILFFFQLPENRFVYPQKPKFKPKTNLRKGSTEEWRNVLNNKQVQKIHELIPDEWFERFNWSKI